MTAGKKSIPKHPESFAIYDEHDDSIFFALDVDAEDHDAAVELSLLVDVKNTGDEDSMEYLYTVFLEAECLSELLKWLKKAIKYVNHVEEHGTPVPLILGVEDEDGNLESL